MDEIERTLEEMSRAVDLICPDDEGWRCRVAMLLEGHAYGIQADHDDHGAYDVMGTPYGAVAQLGFQVGARLGVGAKRRQLANAAPSDMYRGEG